jgi:anti-sigma-K factor RskA
MNCEDVRELLPAYVLGALEPDEIAAVETHLRSGREHDAELVELRATVFALDRLADAPAPSSALAARIDSLTAAKQRPAARAMGRFGWLLGSPYARAAAALAVLLLVFAGGWLSARALSSTSPQKYAYVLQGPNGELLSLNGSAGKQGVTVIMAGLERLPADHSYQIWTVRDGVWEVVGVCNTNAQGAWRGVFPATLESNENIVLTVEPAGGSPTPSSEPLLQTRS